MISRAKTPVARAMDRPLTQGASRVSFGPARRPQAFDRRDAGSRGPAPMQPLPAGSWLVIMALPALLVWTALLSLAI
ncbi:hypothetical protein [Frigidibacter oleivorans]|uniref:hypothetical protein n=1 Tax=Frigidibacter oleivorans TaxID=2487129 RepID=UPI000F8E800B|nr:hypothetical protein [Frigidibacter oleivorans]